MSQEREGLEVESGELPFPTTGLDSTWDGGERGHEREEAPETRLIDSAEHLDITIPIVIRKSLRRSRYQEYPTEVTIRLGPTSVERATTVSGELTTPRMTPISDEPLYRTIINKTGKVAHGYTSRKCSLCERLGFRVCNKSFDQVCVFCQASGAQCEFPSPKGASQSRIKNTSFPREFLYDANRKMRQHIEGFTIPEGASLYNTCGSIPEELCVDSELLDAIHRSASYHCQLLQDWYGESLFEKLDSSALLAMGILAEELVRDQLLGHLVPTEEEHHRQKQRDTRTTGISEFRQNAAKICAREDPALAARIKNWDSQPDGS